MAFNVYDVHFEAARIYWPDVWGRMLECWYMDQRFHGASIGPRMEEASKVARIQFPESEESKAWKARKGASGRPVKSKV